MELSREEVAHIAWLARLSLTAEEQERYAGQLSGVLRHVARLSELDVDNIEPTAMAAESDHNIVRADVPRPSYPQDQVLANAPEADQGCFRAHAILDEEAS